MLTVQGGSNRYGVLESVLSKMLGNKLLKSDLNFGGRSLTKKNWLSQINVNVRLFFSNLHTVRHSNAID